ncbi:adenylate/guanylate cyclase domain-containing protein [Archangium sp.]|uniref:adenylate/guanylate cyclase domain-containing protein n=1 Tax=Archangium sp. TaxID=1872627 RepID=UPI002ED979C2
MRTETSTESVLAANEAVREEAAKGERLVAWIRALMFTAIVSIELFWGQFQTDVPPEVLAFVPFMLAAILLSCWGWLVFLYRRPYRPLLGRISTLFDALLLAAFTFALVLVGFEPERGGVATPVYLGASPLPMFAFFMLLAAGVRQDPVACVLNGAVSLVANGAAAVLARSQADLALIDTMGHFPADRLWLLRAFIFVAATALAAWAASNARKIARKAGQIAGERQKVLQLFGRYVAPEVVRGVLDEDGKGPAELREVTVLFTDLRGFTSLSERMPPHEVLEVLNAHYGAIVPVVHAHGGTVNKFIGDAIMATFGAPVPLADHAERAVRAAVEMLEGMERLNTGFRERGLPELRMGVGVSTGPVVLGTLGTAQRVEYAVIGDTVNTASRLEGLNKELGTEVLLSASTRQALGPAFPVKALGEVPVKGKAQPVPVFTVFTRGTSLPG